MCGSAETESSGMAEYEPLGFAEFGPPWFAGKPDDAFLLSKVKDDC